MACHTTASISEKVDALLLNSGNPNLVVKELGGIGRAHNWSLSRKIVEQSKVPIFLSGGLNAQNVREAIDIVQPFGVDICSGVRTDCKLDERKLEAFFRRFYNNIANRIMVTFVLLSYAQSQPKIQYRNGGTGNTSYPSRQVR